MKTVLLYFAALVALVALGAKLDHHRDLTVLVDAWVASFFIWVMLGALLAARATLRFLRR